MKGQALFAAGKGAALLRGTQKAQVALEYYLLLLAVAVLLVIAVSWISSFTASQKSTYANVTQLVDNVTNSTLGGLGAGEFAGYAGTNSTPMLALEIQPYEPYWTGQPAIFVARIWNRGGGIGKVSHISISVKDANGRNLLVGPSEISGISVPFAYSTTAQFAPNTTGVHTVKVIASTDQGELELSKEMLVLGGG